MDCIPPPFIFFFLKKEVEKTTKVKIRPFPIFRATPRLLPTGSEQGRPKYGIAVMGSCFGSEKFDSLRLSDRWEEGIVAFVGCGTEGSSRVW